MDKNIATSGLSKIDIYNHKILSFLNELSNITGVKLDNIPLNDKDTLKIFIDSDTLNIPYFSSDIAQKLLNSCKSHIKDFDDLVKVFGFGHGTDVWTDNAEHLISNGIAFKNIIGNTEDIVDFLLSYGVDTSAAHKVMEISRRGLATKKQEAKDYIYSLGIEYNLPHWWLESVCKIKYIFKREQAIVCTQLAFKSAYFKVHYPKVFKEFYEKNILC